MTTFNTGNPIGSTDARDRLDNSENMDILENSVTLNEHSDRLGVMRKTRKGMELEHDNQISAHEVEHDNQIAAHELEFNGRLAGMAFTRVGTFTTGATLTDARQVLLYETDGHEYGWTGAFPKVVPPASTPAGTGGVGAGAWVDRTDDTLRDEIRETVFQNMKRLYAEAGFNLVYGSFQLGGSLSGWSDVLWDWASGKGYQWHLDEAKTVAAGSSPTNIGVDWIDKTDASLRKDINVIQCRFSSVAEMKSTITLADLGKHVEWLSYSDGWAVTSYGPYGGNTGVVVAAGTGTADEGSLFDTDSGLQVKATIPQGNIDVSLFGAVHDADMHDAITNAALYARKISTAVVIPSGSWQLTDLQIEGVTILGDNETNITMLAPRSGAPGFTSSYAMLLPNCKLKNINFTTANAFGARSLASPSFGNLKAEQCTVKCPRSATSAATAFIYGGFDDPKIKITECEFLGIPAYATSNINGFDGVYVTDCVFDHRGIRPCANVSINNSSNNYRMRRFEYTDNKTFAYEDHDLTAKLACIDLSNIDSVLIAGNTFDVSNLFNFTSVTQVIHIESTSSDYVISANRFIGGKSPQYVGTTMKHPGCGYTSTVDVFTEDSTASITATVSGFIGQINVTDGGSGHTISTDFSTDVSVAITDPTGTGADARDYGSPRVGSEGELLSIPIYNNAFGSGYTNPTVTVTPGTGSAVTATPRLASGVTSIALNSGPISNVVDFRGGFSRSCTCLWISGLKGGTISKNSFHGFDTAIGFNTGLEKEELDIDGNIFYDCLTAISNDGGGKNFTNNQFLYCGVGINNIGRCSARNNRFVACDTGITDRGTGMSEYDSNTFERMTAANRYYKSGSSGYYLPMKIRGLSDKQSVAISDGSTTSGSIQLSKITRGSGVITISCATSDGHRQATYVYDYSYNGTLTLTEKYHYSNTDSGYTALTFTISVSGGYLTYSASCDADAKYNFDVSVTGELFIFS